MNLAICMSRMSKLYQGEIDQDSLARSEHNMGLPIKTKNQKKKDGSSFSTYTNIGLKQNYRCSSDSFFHRLTIGMTTSMEFTGENSAEKIIHKMWSTTLKSTHKNIRYIYSE